MRRQEDPQPAATDEPKKKIYGRAAYEDYLRSPEWARFRKRYKRHRRWACAVCGETKFLHLHHKTYIRFGHEELDDVVPLCQPCHTRIHELYKAKEIPSLDPIWLNADLEKVAVPAPKPVAEKRVAQQRAGKQRRRRRQKQLSAQAQEERRQINENRKREQTLLDELVARFLDQRDLKNDSKNRKVAKRIIQRKARFISHT